MEVAKQGQADSDSSVCGPNRGPRGLISLDRAIIRVEGYVDSLHGSLNT